MTWEKILKDDNLDFADTVYSDEPRNPPKGTERVKIIRDVFQKLNEAEDILTNAATWTDPDTFQSIWNKIESLIKDVKNLEQEAIEHHGKGD